MHAGGIAVKSLLKPAERVLRRRWLRAPWRRYGRAGAALAGALGLAACVDASPSPEEESGEAQSAVLGGTLDQGTDPKFPAVVGVRLALPSEPNEPASFAVATGVALSKQVVVTAGHIVPGMLRGCEPFTYSATAVPSRPSRLMVLVATGTDGDVSKGTAYTVDAITGHRRLSPLNAYDCGDAPALGCAPDVEGNFVFPFDVALLHLEKPLQGVQPMKFVARIGPTDAAQATYPIDPSTWPGTVIATVVGVGSSNPMPPPAPPTFWLRMYGPTAFTGLGWQSDAALTPGQCDLQTEPLSCARCMLDISPSPSDLLPMGGALRQGGDSGAPLVVNDTALGATPIAGLPPDEPFVVGFGSHGASVNGQPAHDLSVVSWDATMSAGGPTEMGTFLLSHLRDWDQDGVPDADDNCVLAPNADQSNCNEAAEDRWGFPRAGNACDPIPCAEAPLQAAGLDIEASFQNRGGIAQFGREIRDRFDVVPQGSRYTSSGAQNHVELPEVGVGQVPTHYRFCQPDAVAGVVCTKAAIDNAFLHQEPTQPSAQHPWMKVRIQPASTPAGPVFNSESLPYPASPIPRRWRYFNDFSGWLATGKITAPGCNPVNGCCRSVYGCGTNLDGRLWLRSNTSKGTSANPVADPSNNGFAPPFTGFRTKNGGASPLDVQLSNHHLFLAPDATFSATHAVPVAHALPHSVIYKVLPRPPIDPLGSLDPRGWDGVHGEQGYLVATQGGGFGLLRGKGTALVVTKLLGAHLRGLLAIPGLVWASAVEPQLAISRTAADEGFHALAFAADGTDVLDGVLRDGLFAGTTVDFARPPPTRSGSLPRRKGFMAVFSRSEDRAFVLGGYDPSTRKPLHDLWMRPVEGPGEWREIELDDFEVGRVLAATWSYVDHRLWVLDEVAVGSGQAKERRLYRVEPYLGVVQLVGAWPRRAAFDAHFLVLDRDGAVLLAGSSTIKNFHAVVRIEATPYKSGKSQGISFRLRRPNSLACAPFADAVGYSFALGGPEGTLLLERQTELGLLPGSLTDIGSVL